jgi:hypothetical protein
MEESGRVKDSMEELQIQIVLCVIQDTTIWDEYVKRQCGNELMPILVILQVEGGKMIR